MSGKTTLSSKFISRPNQEKIGPLPISAAIILGWVVVLLIAAPTMLSAQRDWLYGAIVLLPVCALSVLMAFVTYDWLKDNRQRYELNIAQDTLTLSQRDAKGYIDTTQQVQLSAVTSAELYSAPDSPLLVLHTSASQLDVPLWSFGPDAGRIVENLEARGVGITKYGREQAHWQLH